MIFWIFCSLFCGSCQFWKEKVVSVALFISSRMIFWDVMTKIQDFFMIIFNFGALETPIQFKFGQIKVYGKSLVSHSAYRQNIKCQKCAPMGLNGNKINIRHPGQLKKWKSFEPFWSYQLNSTANPAHLPQNWAKLAKLAVLFSWYSPLQ